MIKGKRNILQSDQFFIIKTTIRFYLQVGKETMKKTIVNKMTVIKLKLKLNINPIQYSTFQKVTISMPTTRSVQFNQTKVLL